MGRPKAWKTVADRLLDAAVVEPNSGCWIWTGAIISSGYGTMMINRKVFSAHRLSVIHLKGEDPTGKWVCHTCDVPACINPDHLYVGTGKTNAADRTARGRGNPPVGMRCASAKLNDEQVVEIRASTGTNIALGREYGVHASVISEIRSRKIWRHI